LTSILTIDKLTKHFPLGSSPIDTLRHRATRKIHAVDEVSFVVNQGEVFSLVGETGSGKTTIGKMLVRLIHPTRGIITFEGREINELEGEHLKEFRANVQMVFQDPFASLNPRMTIRDIIGLPLKIHRRDIDVDQAVIELMDKVGLSPPSGMIDRHPHEFSGGQRQRIGVARAIALNPKLVVADEPVSSLDVSIRAQILNLLLRLKKEMNLTYILIAHDLSVVRHMSDWVMVLYMGRIMELARTEEMFSNPKHPYTRALMSSVPVPDPKLARQRIRLIGEPSTPVDPPPGCRFVTRCPIRGSLCTHANAEGPHLIAVTKDHFVACHQPLD